MNKKLQELNTQRNDFNEESKRFLDSLIVSEKEIESIDEMKKLQGWQMLEKKIREELQSRILELVKDDNLVQSLLGIINIASTTEKSKQLADEIHKLLPE